MKHEIKENCLYKVDNVANERTVVSVLFTLYPYWKPARQHTVASLVNAISPFMGLISVISQVTTVVVVDYINGETCPTNSSVGYFMSTALQSSVMKEE